MEKQESAMGLDICIPEEKKNVKRGELQLVIDSTQKEATRKKAKDKRAIVFKGGKSICGKEEKKKRH